MKKGFTLVELLIVTVVIVILLTMVFRLSTVVGDSSAMNLTVDRMHRLENALSGYYAAFGTYPPVKLHGNRNPYLEVNEYGDQNDSGSENTSIWGWISGDGNSVQNGEAERAAWRQIRSACVAQPVACMFPFPRGLMNDYIKALSEAMKVQAENSKDENYKRIIMRGFDDGVTENPGRHDPYRNDPDWAVVKLFRFGLMSFLLPRYLVMMTSEGDFFDYAQWMGNNTLPRDPLTGQTMNNWKYMQSNFITKNGLKSSDTAHVANIPSQAVCARWIANFDRSLTCNYSHVLFGVEVWSGKDGEASLSDIDTDDIFVPGGYQNGNSSAQYILDMITMRDGWNNDFYYYSPAPYQSYILWSSGPNGRTFPPWISLDTLDGNASKCVGYWVRDDIINLSH